MRILITGGAGMVGSNLASALLSSGHTVTVIDNLFRGKLEYVDPLFETFKDKFSFHNHDLSKYGEWETLFKDIDVVYDLADVVAGIGYVFKNESYIFNQNLLINSNVINAVRKYNVKRYIYPGTACSFPADLQYGVQSPPLTEDQQIPANPESAYGWSKLMGEFGAKFVAHDCETDSVVLVFHNVYGPPCDFKSDKAQVIPSLIYKCLTCLDNDKKLYVWGDGSQGRAFVHVDDITTSLLQALQYGENQGPIQIGPSECTTIKTIANTIVSNIDPNIEIVYDTSMPVGDKGRCADFSKAQNALNWKPTVDIDNGLSNLIEWIRVRV